MQTSNEPSGTSILERLKSATLEHHGSIEARSPLVRDDLSLPVYAAVLARFRSYYAAWELLASPHFAGPLRPFFERRRKVDRLDHDLRSLGVETPAEGATPAAELPAIDGLPRALGSMYVLEGATLGGRFVARHLEQTLGLRDGVGYSFFRPYGDDVGLMWREFGRLLASASTPATDPHLIASAVATFDGLGRWLDGATA